MFLLKKPVPGDFWGKRLLKKIIWCFSLLIFFAASSLAVTPHEEKAFNEFKELIQKGEGDGEKAASSFIKTFPESDYVPEIKFFLAESESNFYKAVKQYETIVKLYPESEFAALSQVRIAEHYFTFGNFRQARIEWEKYLKLFPEGKEAEKAFLSVGICYYQDKNFDKAIDYFKYFIKSYPQSSLTPRVRFNLAQAYLSKNQSEEAKAELETILNDYPEWENRRAVSNALSEIYSETGEEQKKEALFKKISESSSRPADLKREEPVSSLKDDTAGYYSVQVGAFSDKKRADKLMAQLKSKGYQVYFVSLINRGTVFYRVRIGKYRTKMEAVEAADKIGGEENLPAVVVSGD